MILDEFEPQRVIIIIPAQRIGGWIFTGFVATASFVVAVITWVAAGPTIAGLIVRLAAWVTGVGLLAWFSHRWPAIDYAHASYRVDALGIEIRRGVFWRTVTNVPLSRVQHTDVSQGPLERHHGLGTLIIYTAGTDEASVELPGLAHERALELRDRLLPRATDDAV